VRKLSRMLVWLDLAIRKPIFSFSFRNHFQKQFVLQLIKLLKCYQTLHRKFQLWRNRKFSPPTLVKMEHQTKIIWMKAFHPMLSTKVTLNVGPCWWPSRWSTWPTVPTGSASGPSTRRPPSSTRKELKKSPKYWLFLTVSAFRFVWSPLTLFRGSVCESEFSSVEFWPLSVVCFVVLPHCQVEQFSSW